MPLDSIFLPNGIFLIVIYHTGTLGVNSLGDDIDSNIPVGLTSRSMAKVKLVGYRCDRCEHEWLPREKSTDPKVCPKCKSPYWNTPRKK